LMTAISATIGNGNIAGVGHGHRAGRTGSARMDVAYRASGYGHQIR
jgi:hypothetical protein